MAEDEKKAEAAEGGSGGKKKLIIIIVAVVLLLVVGGVGAFLAMSGGSGGEEEEGDVPAEEGAAEGIELPGAVMPLEVFIVNLQVKGSFLKAQIQLEFVDPELPPTIENDTPKIRDSIIRVLSSKTASEILNPDGKEALKEELKDTVNEVLGAEDVVQVYFTEFIVQ